MDSDGVKIVIQCDTWKNYQQSSVSGSGCTISLTVWGDMPAHNSVLRRNGLASWANLNFARAKAYRSVSGTTPTANVPLTETNIVNLDAFENSPYCQLLRDTYGTYDTYIERNMVAYPQQYGAFLLPHASVLCGKYADLTAPTKDGGTKFKFPAMHGAYGVGYDAEGLEQGSWWLSDIHDGAEYMDDATLRIIAKTQSKMGIAVTSNSSTRWFCQRNNASNAWSFSGTSGHLNGGVSGTLVGQAVTLLKI